VTGQSLTEAKNINKSLSALAHVFESLSKQAAHVPFRDSTLTYLLEPALSGQGKTLMIVNLSPTELSVSESISTLRFGSKVKSTRRLPPCPHLLNSTPALWLTFSRIGMYLRAR